MAIAKKINDGSVSSSVREPKTPKLTTDTLYKYLQFLGGEPVIVKPDGKQATKGKFAFGEDIGLNNEFTKMPEIHTRFDDPRVASMVAKELATGELTVGMQRNPETGEIETITKKYEPIPSRGNTQVRRYGLGNDPTGAYVALNKPEEAYKAPRSLKELQADTRKAYQELGVSTDMTTREFLAAMMPFKERIAVDAEFQGKTKLVLQDLRSRNSEIPAPPKPTRSPLTQEVMQQVMQPESANKQAITPEPSLRLNRATDTGGWANAVGEPYEAVRSPEPTFKNQDPRFRAEMGNPMNPTGMSDRTAYERAKSGYEGYQRLGYAPADKPFPTLAELQKQAKSEGVRPDAFQNYIKGKLNAPLIDSGVIQPPELPMTARLGQEYISPKTGKLGTVESVGTKGVKLNVDGQAVPVEYQTLEKLKYTGNKGYGFATPAALRPALGGLAGGTAGSALFKQLAKSAGLDEDQQNAAAATGGIVGSLTGSALSTTAANTKLRMPTAREFAQTMMGTPQSRSAGARLFDLASSQSGALSMDQRQKAQTFNQQYEAGAIAKQSYSGKFAPIAKLTPDQSAAEMGMTPKEFRDFQERAYRDFAPKPTEPSKGSKKPPKYVKPERFVVDPQVGDRVDMDAYRKANAEWRRSTDEATKPLREAFDQAAKTGDKELQRAALEAMEEIKSTLPPAPVKANFVAPLEKPKKSSGGFGKMQPKQSNFIAESTVQAAAQASGASSGQVKAQLASQRAAGQAPDLNMATAAIAPKPPSKELATRTENPTRTKELSTRVLSRQQPDGMIVAPSVGMTQQRTRLRDRIGGALIKGFDYGSDVTQAAQTFSESVNRGESGGVATARAVTSVGSAYGVSAIANSLPLPAPAKLLLTVGGSLAAAYGADKAIDQVVGRDAAKESKFSKDLSKLNLAGDPESEMLQPFGKAGDRDYLRAYGNSLVNTATLNMSTAAPELGRSLANLVNKNSIENARYALERGESVQMGQRAKSGQSTTVFRDRGDGVTEAIGRRRGFTDTESRVLALQNLANESGYEVPRTGKFDAKLTEALDKLGYSDRQIGDYIQGNIKELGKPVPKSSQVTVTRGVPQSKPKVTSQQLSAALAAERKAQGLKYGQVLSDSQVDSVFRSMSGQSLSQLRQSAKVGGAKTQSALRLGAGI